jgi:hypothetical protein
MNHEPPTGTDPEPSSGLYRQCFENGLQHFSTAERMVLARTAGEPILTAICFDPLPRVFSSLLENPRFGLDR